MITCAGKRVAMAALNLRDPDLVAAGELLAKRREKAHARDAKPNDLFTLGPVTSHRKSTPCGGATLAACARYIRDMADVAVDCRRWLSKTRASARGPRCLRWRNAANRSCAARLCSMRPPACRCPWCRGAQEGRREREHGGLNAVAFGDAPELKVLRDVAAPQRQRDLAALVRRVLLRSHLATTKVARHRLQGWELGPLVVHQAFQ